MNLTIEAVAQSTVNIIDQIGRRCEMQPWLMFAVLIAAYVLVSAVFSIRDQVKAAKRHSW